MTGAVCAESVLGKHDADRAGRCRWCGARCESAVPAPQRTPRSDLSQAYGYFYDPDFGNSREDVYE